MSGTAEPPHRSFISLDRRQAIMLCFQMRPLDIQQIGDELAVKWDDGTEGFVKLEVLRRHCPCAGCQGERDIMGNLYKGPDKTLTPDSFKLVRIAAVGGYALQPLWADGHGTGLFAFDYLKKVMGAN